MARATANTRTRTAPAVTGIKTYTEKTAKAVEWHNDRFNTLADLKKRLRSLPERILREGDYSGRSTYPFPTGGLADQVASFFQQATGNSWYDLPKKDMETAYIDFMQRNHSVDTKDPREMDKAEFEAYIAKRVMAFPQGCAEGKRQFVESLGIELPPRSVSGYIGIVANSATVADFDLPSNTTNLTAEHVTIILDKVNEALAAADLTIRFGTANTSINGI